MEDRLIATILSRRFVPFAGDPLAMSKQLSWAGLRPHVGSILAAGGIFLAVVSREADLTWPIMWTCLGLGVVVLGPRLSDWRITLGLVVILASHAVAIPGSQVWGTQQRAELLWAANHLFWLAPLACLYLIQHHRVLVLRYACFFYLIEAAAIFVDTPWTAEGFALTSNAAGGTMAVAAVFSAKVGLFWLAPIFYAATAYTGSKTALILLSVAMAAVVIRWNNDKPTLIAAAVLFGVLLFPIVPNFSVGHWGDEMALRHFVSRTPQIFPAGPVPTLGLHSVPMRMSAEIGILALGAWLWLTVWALARRPRLTADWWALALILAISGNDYYTWLGQLAPVWWLLIGRGPRCTQHS